MKAPTKLSASEKASVIKKAEKEIVKLRRELKAGTLDQRKLEFALEKLEAEVSAIADRVPPFGQRYLVHK